MTEDNGAMNSAHSFSEGAEVPSKITLENVNFAHEDLQKENDALREALKDIIKFCEQFELSESKIEALNEYKKLLSS
jgi:hypothetical protein